MAVKVSFHPRQNGYKMMHQMYKYVGVLYHPKKKNDCKSFIYNRFWLF